MAGERMFYGEVFHLLFRDISSEQWVDRDMPES